MTSWPLSIINTLTVLLAGTERLRAYSFKRIKDNLSTELDSSYALMIVVIIAKRFPALTVKKIRLCPHKKKCQLLWQADDFQHISSSESCLMEPFCRIIERICILGFHE